MLKDKIFRNHEFKYSSEIFLRTLICSWFFVGAVNLLFHGTSFTSLEFIQGKTVYFVLTLVLLALSFCGLTAVEYFLSGKKITEYSMCGSYIAFAVLSLMEGTSVENTIAFTVGGVLVFVYALNKGCFEFGYIDISRKMKIILVASLASLVAIFISVYGIAKHNTYGTPNFDFGIFCHMFHNMSESLVPNTTCERDMLLSHFAVHFSPICYVLLPIYWIFPFAETLQISQAIILISGVIPLVLVAKERGISNRVSGIIAFLYCVFPAITTGCSYDFHENCFILPLLLWMFYFCEKDRYVPIIIFTLLTLLVKEDAFIYVIVYGAYLIVARKKGRTGALMCAGALLYFAISYTILTNFGLGIMDDSRFGNLIYGDGGLLGVIKTVVVNPAYAFSQLFASEAGYAGKIEYIFVMLAPLMFMPFVTKKAVNLILVAPMLINLLSVYPYQCDIGFQYHFGITAFLMYATVVNVSEMGSKLKRYLGVLACVATIIIFVGFAPAKMGPYIQYWSDTHEEYSKMDDILEEYIPDDASVACTTYLVPQLYKRAEIYETFYHKENGKAKTDVDYVVFLMRGSYVEESRKEAKPYIKAGYEEVYNGDMLWILKSPDA